MNEGEFIAALRALGPDPAARGFLDDAAVLSRPAGDLVITTDTLVESVHFLSGDPPGDVAHKVLATNLSDLAAKGARPLGVFLNYALIGPESWHREFLAGLAASCKRLQAPLLGGDTVSPRSGPRTFSLTALGEAGPRTPSRSDARAGQGIWVTGTLGDAGAGLRALQGVLAHHDHLVARYRRPEPRLAEGRALAPHVSAMMDVSDGLLIDLSRMATASGLAALIHLERLPLSEPYGRIIGGSYAARIVAATAGDDYELLFASDGEPPVPATRIGEFAPGTGLNLFHDGEPVPLPATLGWEHGAT